MRIEAAGIALSEPLRKKILSGAFWLSASHYIALAASVGTQVAFARMMSLEELGRFALAFAYSEVASSVADLSLNRAVIHELGAGTAPKRHVLGSAWVLVSGQMIAFASIAALISWQPLHTLSWNPWPDAQTAHLVVLLVVSKAITKPGFLGTAMLELQLRYGWISGITVTAAICGAGVGLWAGWSGLGALAICLRELTNSMVYAVLGVALGREFFALKLKRSSAQALLRYSLKLLGSTVSDRIANQLDSLLLGRFVGLDVLGLYSYARRATTLAVSAFLPLVQRILFAAYVRRAEPAAERRIHSRASVLLVALGGVVGAALVLFPREILVLAFGSKFAAAALPLTCLAALPALSLVLENDRTFLMARQQFGLLIAVRYAQCVAMLLLVPLAWHFELLSLGSIASLVVFLEGLALIAVRVLGLSGLYPRGTRGLGVLALTCCGITALAGAGAPTWSPSSRATALALVLAVMVGVSLFWKRAFWLRTD